MTDAYFFPRSIVLATAIVIIGMGTGFVLVSYPLWVIPWMHEFHASRGEVMLPLTIGHFSMSLLAPLAGGLIARFSARISILIGVTAMSLAFLLSTLVGSYWGLVMTFGLLAGVGLGFAGILAGQTVAVQCFPDRAGAAGGFLILGQSLASVLAPIIISPIIQWLGWRTAFEVLGATIAAIGIPAALILLAPARSRSGTIVARPSHKLDLAVLRNGAFWLILGTVLPLLIAANIVQPSIVGIANDAGIATGSAGLLVASGAGGGAIGAIAVGAIIDRCDPRLIYSLVVGAACIAVAAMIDQSNALILGAGLALLGVACGAAMPVAGVLTLRTFGPERFPKVFGMIVPLLLPAAIGPIVGGWLRDRTGSYDMMLLLTSALVLAGIAAIWGLRRDVQLHTPQRAGPPSPSDTKI